MPAVTTITQLPGADLAALTGDALVAVDDALGVTRKVTLAQLRGAAGIFDVRAYGATGDGVTDDTAAFQAAVDAADAAGGGTVTIPTGAYVLSRQGTTSPASAAGGYAVRMKSGVSIRGDGISSVVLNTGMLPGASTSDNATWYSAFECLDGTHDLEITGVRFLGDNDPFVDKIDGTHYQRQMDCIGMRGSTCHDITVAGCWFESQIGFTVHLEGFGQRVHVIDCVMRNCANGLNVNSDYSLQARNILDHCESIECSGAYTVITQNIITAPTESGIGVGGFTTPGAPPIPGVVITGNVITDGHDAGITATDGIDGAIISNNTITRTVRSGVMLANGGFNPVQRVRVMGNTLIDCGKLSNPGGLGDRCGIYAPYNPEGSIENNTIMYGVTAGYETAYGMLIGPTASGLRVRGNRVTGAFKAISNQSPNVLIADDNVLDWSAVELVGAGSYMAGPNREGVVVVSTTSGGTVVLDPRAGTFFRVNIVDTVAFAIQTNGSIGGLAATQTQRMTVVFANTSGGTPAITFGSSLGSGFRTAGAVTTPANAKIRTISFYWDQPAQLWVEYQRAAADI